jgi:uncharacterized protein YqgC (DUF456 family)
MVELSQAVAFGLAAGFIFLGIIGTLIPIIPGTFLVWVTVLLYALFERVNGFMAIDIWSFAFLTLIALVTGLADVWLPLLGGTVRKTSKRAMLFGLIGGTIGTFIAPLVGTIAGYALGILLGEFHKVRDVSKAFRASLEGVAHWGVGTVIQFAGAVLIMIIFIWQVLISL